MKTFHVQSTRWMFVLVSILVMSAVIQIHSKVTDDLVFIHHSCGENWLNSGLNDALVAKEYIDERNDIYYGTVMSPDPGRPASLGEVPGDNTNMDHWILWFNDYLDQIKEFGSADGYNRIIMFKSCFPISDIYSEGTEPGDPLGDQTLANYKAVYRHPEGPDNHYSFNDADYFPLEDIFARHPEILFIPVTAPPLCYGCTDDANAHRARIFNNWLKTEWLSSYRSAHPGLSNVAVFDWFDVLANADNFPGAPNRLKASYGGTSDDSHPNETANAASTVVFATGTDNFLDAAWNAYSEASSSLFTVVNTEDSGPGSLRQAILNANDHAGPDTIDFDIPETGVIFNGQCWFIEPFFNLPELMDDGTVIDGTTQTALHGETNPNGPEVYLFGYQGRNGYPVSWGLYIQSSNNVIRGLIVSCFNGTAITISGDSARYNRIEGNYIGTNFGGSDTLESPNMNGIRISDGAKHNTVGGSSVEERNLISGNLNEGITITRADSNRVIGNTIGTNITGTQPLGNGSDGIRILEGSNNEIGGFREGEGNLISGNNYDGLVIRGEDSDSNIVVGNYIGVDRSGTKSLGNTEHGVRIDSGANDNRIGGSIEGEGNVISGNGRHGIQISGTGTDGNRIIGNAVGSDAGGTVSLGNGWEGIYLCDGSQKTSIGPDNIVANNGHNGFYVGGENTLFHTMTQNSIFSNQEAGIEIAGGGNLELASPILAGLNPVSGTAVPNGKVEIFSDSSDEGRIYEGFTIADGSGNFTWAGTPSGPNVTATVTDANGNTSEFSVAIQLTGVEENGNTISETFSLSQNYPNPFNPTTTIRFDVPIKTHVRIAIFDLTGRMIRSLVDEIRDSGSYRVVFDATGLASGIYFYRIRMNDFTEVKKMVFLE